MEALRARPRPARLPKLSADRKAVRLLQQAHPDWFEVHWLPAYAPELNPVEMVWNRNANCEVAC